jgi:hypothetical protein
MPKTESKTTRFLMGRVATGGKNIDPPRREIEIFANPERQRTPNQNPEPGTRNPEPESVSV